jgi:hypothetical protein
MTTCSCDHHPFPLPPSIAPGLAALPRQIGIFADFRASLLSRIREHPALTSWRARDQEDFGLMLIEWWAYVADVVAFYNSELAQDCYLGTAREDEALRKITALIGYKPRPGLAAEAILAAISEGSDPVEAPPGTGFISDAIDDTPPQHFELTAATQIDPLRNEWTIAPIRRTDYDPDNLLIDPASRNIAEEMLVVLDANGTRAALKIASLASETALDGQTYLRMTVTEPGDLPGAGASLSQTRLWAFTQNAPVTSISGSTVTLSGLLPQLRKGELAVVEDLQADNPAEPQVFTISAVAFKSEILVPEDSTAGTPAVTAPVTNVTLSGSPEIASHTSGRLHFGRVRAGRLVAPALPRIDGSRLAGGAGIAGRYPLPTVAGTGELLLKGAGERGEKIAATVDIDANSGAATLLPTGAFTAFGDELSTPVKVHGNLLHVTRGKSVEELLGSGKGASRPFQTFTLAKKPLTYLYDQNATGGRRSTLRIWCDGVEWDETDSLFLAGPADRVFTVDLDGEGAATVTFGDGVNGMVPPVGDSNIRAEYRFGGGEPPPGADQIRQIAGAVPRLRRVFNPTAAFGGMAGDRPEDIRWNAPASAASFDRAVSASDFAALARDWGALAATAISTWMADRQKVGVQVTATFDGTPTDDDLARLQEHLAARASELLPITVREAKPLTGTLRLSYRSARNASADAVKSALEAAFNDEFTGYFSPRRAAIGGPVFRSAILGIAGAIAGVETLTALTWNDLAAPRRIPVDEDGYFAPTLVLEDVA